VKPAFVASIVSLFVVVAACGGRAGAVETGRGQGGGNIDAACTTNADCTQSYCNGTWVEGGSCKSSSDCAGYVAAAGGYQPPAPNKRCIDGVCHQVGSCSNDHS
jgi:hypothetical protein